MAKQDILDRIEAEKLKLIERLAGISQEIAELSQEEAAINKALEAFDTAIEAVNEDFRVSRSEDAKAEAPFLKTTERGIE